MISPAAGAANAVHSKKLPLAKKINRSQVY